MPGWLSRWTAPLARAAGNANAPVRKELNPREVVEMMEWYYYNNDLYLALAELMRDQDLWHEGMKPLRNPTFAVVEFYALTLWPGALPGALPIVTKNDKIKEPIEQIWKWSNWGAKKQLAARLYPMTGDMFIRVRTNGTVTPEGKVDVPADKVRIQPINAKYVTDFDVDEEGHVVWLRYDVARWKRNDKGERVNYTHTEVWDHEKVQTWEHDKSPGADLVTIGDPDSTVELATIGIDFVPWVHAPFRDVGELRGLPATWTQLSKIDELNRKATRQASMMFRYNKPLFMAMSGMVDADGGPGVAPSFEVDETAVEGSDTLTWKDDILLELPGMNRIESLVPNLNWHAFIAVIEKDMEEIKRDLPELRYYDMLTMSNDSGRALQIKLTPAVTLVNEVRGGAETALARAHKMALTIGKHLGLDGFTSIGDKAFDVGELEHTFAGRDVIPLTEDDRASTAKTYVEMGLDRNSALKRAGWTDTEIEPLPPLVTTAGTPEEQDLAFQVGVDKAVAQGGEAFDAALQSLGDRALDQLLTTGGIERLATAVAEAGGNGAGQGGAA